MFYLDYSARSGSLAPDTATRIPAFCVSSQIQQLGKRIDMRFTVHDYQALQAVPGIVRRLHGRLYRLLLNLRLLHALCPHGQIAMIYII